MVRAILDARLLLAIVVAAVVGVCGLQRVPDPAGRTCSSP